MKLTYQRILRIVKRYEKGLPTLLIAKQFDISQRRVQQVVAYYRKTCDLLPIAKPGRKPYRKEIPGIKEKILRLHNKYGYGATYIAKYLRDKHCIRLSNNYVHGILLDEGLAMENKRKQKRRKPWVRYEREHSLSLVHMDWLYNEKLEKWMCATLDDASRDILSGGEYDNPTAKHSIALLDEAYNKYLHIRPIQQVITDHGSQFYANKKDKHGKSESSFQKYCREKRIKHILCRYKHPQSNGKFEKWNHLYRRFRHKFNSFHEFMVWYNNRPHGSLDFITPEQAFWQKLQEFVLGGFLKWAEIQ